MNLNELYDRIVNPLDLNVTYRLIDIFCKPGIFYSNLTKMNKNGVVRH